MIIRLNNNKIDEKGKLKENRKGKKEKNIQSEQKRIEGRGAEVRGTEERKRKGKERERDRERHEATTI